MLHTACPALMLHTACPANIVSLIFVNFLLGNWDEVASSSKSNRCSFIVGLAGTEGPLLFQCQ